MTRSGTPDLHAPEPRRLLEERVGRDRDARHDDAPRVLPLLRHDVEGRRRSEVHDDAGAAQPGVRRDRVDDAVGADLLRHVVEDRHPRLDARLDEERLLPRDLAQRLAQRELQGRHDARDDDFPRRLPAAGGLEQPSHGQHDLVGRRLPPRREPPVVQEARLPRRGRAPCWCCRRPPRGAPAPAASPFARPRHGRAPPRPSRSRASGTLPPSGRGTCRRSPGRRAGSSSGRPRRCTEALSHAATSISQRGAAISASRPSSTAWSSGASAKARPASSSSVVAPGDAEALRRTENVQPDADGDVRVLPLRARPPVRMPPILRRPT